MKELPPEYKAEPVISLDGGSDGMDFIRKFLNDAPAHLSDIGVIVLEVGHEREHFENAFSNLECVWLETSQGEDQVVLITKAALSAYAQHPDH